MYNKVKKVFIDCGYHLGEGLTEFTDMLKINSEWDVYAFEANPYCSIEEKVNQHPFKVNAFNKAVWISNDRLVFNCQHQDSASSPKENSTHKLDGWGSFLQAVNSQHIYESQQEVECIDFSKFLEQFTEAEVYVKMDIEGAEFEVLRKCIKDNTISNIKTLWVEWHDIDIETESPETIQEIRRQMGTVEIINWK